MIFRRQHQSSFIVAHLGIVGIVGQEATDDCPNPCPNGFNGFTTRPGSECTNYVSCGDGLVVQEMECFGDTIFNEEAKYCDWPGSYTCLPVTCPERGEGGLSSSPSLAQQSSSSISSTPNSSPPNYSIPTSTSSTTIPDSNIFTSNISTEPPTVNSSLSAEPPEYSPPTTPNYMPSYDHYHYIRTYLEDRENLLNAIVFQSNGVPSTAYKFSDFMQSLEIAFFRFPVDKAFYLGDATMSGMIYGFVNLAAFLSSAMEEGIRLDSCDEFNTDAMYGVNYPLSNACGQYGRSWDLEECSGMEPFHCALDKTMETTAVDTGDSFIPPFTCRPPTNTGDFPGYFDSVNNLVEESPYSNTVGRTDIEGCCWWGRGALLTRGRCTLGKLNAYLGAGALENGIEKFYPDVNFCMDPEVICKHSKTNELRWVLGMLEWSDRIQSYNNLNPVWNYMDELMYFADGYSADRVIHEDFIMTVVNITTQNCHDDSCWNRWDLSEKKHLFIESRVDHFTKILTKVFDASMSYRPTESPIITTFYPSPRPTVSPEVTTSKPTRRQNMTIIQALPPNPAQRRNGCCGRAALATIAIFIFTWA